MNSGPTRALTALAPTLACFLLLWTLMDRSAAALSSMRGEFGLLVCVIVMVAALTCESALSHTNIREAARALGLRSPTLSALLSAIALAGTLLLIFPLYSTITGASLTLRLDWAVLAVGIFAQGGVGEEIVFRGFLFRRLRQGRSFGQAATVSAGPFVLVHALLFLTLDFQIALAALLVSLSLAFPMAWLFERSAGSVLPPAIVHGVVQGAIKVVEDGPAFPMLALAWMGACATAPWLLFALRPARES